MLHRFPHHATHRSSAASTPAASSDTRISSSLIAGVGSLIHTDRCTLGLEKHSHHTQYQIASVAKMQELPLEIIQQIYKFLPDIESVHALSATCHMFHRAYAGSQKLVMVKRVLETQFGPLRDVIQLATFNSSQPAYQVRTPSFSLALAKQIVEKGRIANKWVALYPMLRWRANPENRRFLHLHERYRLRRAMYRLWLYNLAAAIDCENGHSFHNDGNRQIRQFSTREIRELEELREVFFDTLLYDCCPSNSTIQQHYAQGLPTRDLLYFGTYDTHPTVGIPVPKKINGKSLHELLVAESWGDNYTVANVALCLVSMTPDQLLYFREVCTSKYERKRFLRELKDAKGRPWNALQFASSHFVETSMVVRERGGEELEPFEREWITEGDMVEGEEEEDEDGEVDTLDFEEKRAHCSP